MSFDTESAGCSVATGFIVDAARGLILTNRHVVHQGPVTAEAIFLNDEEVPVEQLFSDPVPPPPQHKYTTQHNTIQHNTTQHTPHAHTRLPGGGPGFPQVHAAGNPDGGRGRFTTSGCSALTRPP
jgi:hypothetical protein